jgi:hypothetical protein
MPVAFKFDLFPARSFPARLDGIGSRGVPCGQLSETPAPFVKPEDILLAKLHWCKAGGEVSEMQWRDIQGIVRGRSATLDRGYLERSVETLAVRNLPDRALSEA